MIAGFNDACWQVGPSINSLLGIPPMELRGLKLFKRNHTSVALEGRMLIDAHHHLWSADGAVELEWTADVLELRRSFDLDDLAPELTSAGVDHTVVVEACGGLPETKRLLASADGTEIIAGVVGWVDLTAPDAEDVICGLQDGAGGKKLRGIRVGRVTLGDKWIEDIRGSGNLKAIADHGLVLDVLAWPREAVEVAEMARSHPDLRIVINHLGRPTIDGSSEDELIKSLAILSREQNVFMKFAGLATTGSKDRWPPVSPEPFIETVLDEFGSHRLVLGSDWPVCLLSGATYSTVMGAYMDLLSSLSESELTAALGGTAQSLYGLDI